jgi:threonyl-tRNA synthetase
VRILPVSDDQRSYAQETVKLLKQQGFRVEIAKSGDRLGKQIRNAEVEKIPVVAVVGKREAEDKTLSIRTRSGGELGVLTLEQLQERLREAIENKSVI